MMNPSPQKDPNIYMYSSYEEFTNSTSPLVALPAIMRSQSSAACSDFSDTSTGTMITKAVTTAVSLGLRQHRFNQPQTSHPDENYQGESCNNVGSKPNKHFSFQYPNSFEPTPQKEVTTSWEDFSYVNGMKTPVNAEQNHDEDDDWSINGGFRSHITRQQNRGSSNNNYSHPCSSSSPRYSSTEKFLPASLQLQSSEGSQEILEGLKSRTTNYRNSCIEFESSSTSSGDAGLRPKRKQNVPYLQSSGQSTPDTPDDDSIYTSVKPNSIACNKVSSFMADQDGELPAASSSKRSLTQAFLIIPSNRIIGGSNAGSFASSSLSSSIGSHSPTTAFNKESRNITNKTHTHDKFVSPLAQCRKNYRDLLAGSPDPLSEENKRRIPTLRLSSRKKHDQSDQILQPSDNPHDLSGRKLQQSRTAGDRPDRMMHPSRKPHDQSERHLCPTMPKDTRQNALHSVNEETNLNNDDIGEFTSKPLSSFSTLLHAQDLLNYQCSASSRPHQRGTTTSDSRAGLAGREEVLLGRMTSASSKVSMPYLSACETPSSVVTESVQVDVMNDSSTGLSVGRLKEDTFSAMINEDLQSLAKDGFFNKNLPPDSTIAAERGRGEHTESSTEQRPKGGPDGRQVGRQFMRRSLKMPSCKRSSFNSSFSSKNTSVSSLTMFSQDDSRAFTDNDFAKGNTVKYLHSMQPKMGYKDQVAVPDEIPVVTVKTLNREVTSTKADMNVGIGSTLEDSTDDREWHEMLNSPDQIEKQRAILEKIAESRQSDKNPHPLSMSLHFNYNLDVKKQPADGRNDSDGLLGHWSSSNISDDEINWQFLEEEQSFHGYGTKADEHASQAPFAVAPPEPVPSNNPLPKASIGMFIFSPEFPDLSLDEKDESYPPISLQGEMKILANDEQVFVRGLAHCFRVIEERQTTVVFQCLHCQDLLKAEATAELIYCRGCHQISPMDAVNVLGIRDIAKFLSAESELKAKDILAERTLQHRVIFLRAVFTKKKELEEKAACEASLK